MEKVKIIAYYLPQFHPCKQNNEWWGKGFTEWTNVAKAKPLFKGHYQPKIPSDLGFYDLRLPEVREEQVQLAREAGVYGFCYWHYWFGNGKRLLERPFEEVLESGKPDFPFCLGWANHSWYAKLWDKDTRKDKLLIEQKYLGKEDYVAHFMYALKAFKDKRYIKDGDKPVFYIFRPLEVPTEFIETWQELAKENGFPNGIAFIGECTWNDDAAQIRKRGFDYVLMNRFGAYYGKDFSLLKKIKQHLKSFFFHKPLQCFDYLDFVNDLMDEKTDVKPDVIPMIMPNWDHSPRSGRKAVILENSSPERFRKHLDKMLSIVCKKPTDKRFVFLKSWNEWGEGNYMEPDLQYGKGYINVLRDALK